jgi:hypothetical protein
MKRGLLEPLFLDLATFLPLCCFSRSNNSELESYVYGMPCGIFGFGMFCKPVKKMT